MSDRPRKSVIKIPIRIGPSGETGEKGLKGLPGIDGVDGKDGSEGIQGPKGESGNKGEDGRDGLHGKDGVHGRDGKDGTAINSLETDGKRVRLVFADGTHSAWEELNIKDGTNGSNGKNGLGGKDGKNGLGGKKAAQLKKLELRGMALIPILDDDTELDPINIPRQDMGGGSGFGSFIDRSKTKLLLNQAYIEDDYIVLRDDVTIVASATSIAINITLPDPTVDPGRILYLVSKYDSTFPVKLIGKIDGDVGGFSLSSSENLSLQSVANGSNSFEWVVFA